MLNVLLILDKLSVLDPKFDSSLLLAAEFEARGSVCYKAEIGQIYGTENTVFGYVSLLHQKKHESLVSPRHSLWSDGFSQKTALTEFDLIVVRKEPPFDLNYLYLTYLLETIQDRVVISNAPAGIRNTNEKLGCFLFPKLSPRSLVTSNAREIVNFSRMLEKEIVLKPLNNRAGYGMERLSWKMSHARSKAERATDGGTRMILAQEFIGQTPYRDTRITLLDGRVLFAYEKRAAKKDFRANLSQGGSAHPVKLKKRDQAILKRVRPYLKRQGIHLAGLDILDGKLIDLNVTCPGGFADSLDVYPKANPVKEWADFLEKQAKKKL